MEEIRAAGCLLYRREQERLLYLTLKSADHGDVGFAKGHREPSETDRACALRETAEETGVAADQLELDSWFVRESVYAVAGRPKRVVYWLAAWPGGELQLSKEHCDGKWLEFSAALDALPHENLRTLLREAATYLKDAALRRGLTPAAARALLIERAGEQAPVVAHSRQVASIARVLGEPHDPLAIEPAAWLHDIGRTETHDMRHTVEGFRIVCAEGFPGYAPSCISHFLKGRQPEEAGLPADFVRELRQSCRLDTFPLEERIVAMADYMALGPHRVRMEERYRDLVRRYGASAFLDENHAAMLRVKQEFEQEFPARPVYQLLGC